MTPEQTGSILAYFAEAWVWADVSENSVTVWADQCEHVIHADAVEAAKRIVQTSDRPPSIAAFLAECRNITRSREAPRSLEPAPMRPKREQARRLAAVAAFWDEATRFRPQHDHKRGAELCPRCSTRDAFLAEHTPEIDSILKEHK